MFTGGETPEQWIAPETPVGRILVRYPPGRWV